jgi:hypothetical protein
MKSKRKYGKKEKRIPVEETASEWELRAEIEGQKARVAHGKHAKLK